MTTDNRSFIPRWMRACWCGKPAIGYQFPFSGSPYLCEDHCNKKILSMPPNSILQSTSLNSRVTEVFIRFPESPVLYPNHSVFHLPKIGDHLNRYNTYTHTYSLFENNSDYNYMWLLINKYTTFSKEYDEYIEDSYGFTIDICPNCGQGCRDVDISYIREPHGEYLPDFWVCSNCNSKWCF